MKLSESVTFGIVADHYGKCECECRKDKALIRSLWAMKEGIHIKYYRETAREIELAIYIQQVN